MVFYNCSQTDCVWLFVISRKLRPLRRFLRIAKCLYYSYLKSVHFDDYLDYNIGILDGLKRTSKIYRNLCSNHLTSMTPILHEARILLYGLHDEMIRLRDVLRCADVCDDNYFHKANAFERINCCHFNDREMYLNNYTPRYRECPGTIYVSSPTELARLYANLTFDSVWLSLSDLQTATKQCERTMCSFLTATEGARFDMLSITKDEGCLFCLKIKHLYPNLVGKSHCEHMSQRATTRDSSPDLLQTCDRHPVTGHVDENRPHHLQDTPEMEYWREAEALTDSGTDELKQTFIQCDTLKQFLHRLIKEGPSTSSFLEEFIDSEGLRKLPASFRMANFPQPPPTTSMDLVGFKGIKKVTILDLLTDLLKGQADALAVERKETLAVLREHSDSNTYAEMGEEKLICGDLHWIDSLSRLAEMNAREKSERRIDRLRVNWLKERIDKLNRIIDSLQVVFLERSWGNLLQRVSFDLTKTCIARTIFWNTVQNLGCEEITTRVPCDNSIIGNGTLPKRLQCHSDVLETVFCLATHDSFLQNDTIMPVCNSVFFQIALENVCATSSFKMDVLKVLLRKDVIGNKSDFGNLSSFIKSPEGCFWKPPIGKTKSDDIFLFYLKYIRELVLSVYMFNCNTIAINNLNIYNTDSLQSNPKAILGPFTDGSFEYNLQKGVYLTHETASPLVLVMDKKIYTSNDVFRLLHCYKQEVEK